MVAMLVALAMLQIMVAAIILSGARSDELTSLRLDTSRAFYAAEAGVNMAAREVMLEADADADGVVGSISNDGNAANDPALGVARVTAVAVPAGASTTVTITGRSGQAARRVTLTIAPE